MKINQKTKYVLQQIMPELVIYLKTAKISFKMLNQLTDKWWTVTQCVQKLNDYS